MNNVKLKERLVRVLRWSERYTKTDMVYFASGNFWLITSRVIGVGSGIFLTVAFANLLDPAIFGTYKYVLALAGIIGAFSLNGMVGSVIRSVAQGYQDIIRPIFWESIRWSLPASLIAIVGASYYFFQGNVVLGGGLLLIAIFSPFFNGFIVSKALLLGKKDFKTNALYSVHRSLIPVISIITVLIFTKSLLFILIAYFLSNFIAGWLTYVLSLKKYSIKKRVELDQETTDKVIDTVIFGKHLSAIGVFLQIVGYIDQLLLWHFVGPVQLAIYALAQAPVKEIRNFSENFFPLIFPKLVTKSIADIKKTLPLRILQMFSVSVLVAGIYILLAPFLFKFLFPQYIESIFASQLLAIAILFQPKGLIEATIDAHAKIKKKYISAFSTSTVKLILMLVLIPLYGFIGAISAIIISELVSSIILLFLYKRL